MNKENRLSGELVKGHTAMLVLAIIGENPRHGYEIMKTLEERSRGALGFGQGTIYPLLYSLEEQGLVCSDNRIVHKRRRRVYRLTAAGRKSLGERKNGWTSFQSVINNILNPRMAGGS